jgi:hypothetical protein
MDFSHGNKGGSDSSFTADNLLIIEKYTRFFATFMMCLQPQQ